MNVPKIVKLFFLLFIVTVFGVLSNLSVMKEILGFNEGNPRIKNITKFFGDFQSINVSSKSENLKYILQWTSSRTSPFVYMGQGQSVFLEQNCEFTNCFVTSDKDLLGDYTKFDVVAFAGPELRKYFNQYLPQKRSPHQKYVFGTIESADNYPVCSKIFDGYFNWTWTYRLDSESKWGYLVVRDINGSVIGPKNDMHWIELKDMDPVPKEMYEKLKTKTKLAAWFVSNCVSKSKRESYVKLLNKELKKSGYEVDIFGLCGKKNCSRSDENKCDEMISRDYYFYLAFENSFSEDYVTEKLVRALQNNAVPIVYGGANYTKFMPKGIYLDAIELGAKKLAVKMLELMNDFDEYVQYFKWTNHYYYHRRNVRRDTNDYCGFCALLNNEKKVKEISIYENFSEWWNPKHACSKRT